MSVAGSVRPGSSSRNVGPGSYSNRPQSAAGSINAAPTNHGRYSSKHLPYALVDFDKNQTYVDAVSGTPENPLWAGANTQYKFDVSRVTDLTISLYIRNPTAPPSAGRSGGIFIGTLKIIPRFEEQRTDEKSQKGEAARGQAGAEWIPVQFGTGQLRVGVNFVENRQDRLTIDDFELLKVVGKGSFGKVMQVKYALIPAFGYIENSQFAGRKTPSESMPSRPFAKLISFPGPKWRTLLQSDRCWLKSTILSSYH